MKEIDICYGTYASQWGLTDFYPKSEQILRDAIASGVDFDTGWFGCKKEVRYARVLRDDKDITIEVSCHMDDLYGDDNSLIYDALWEECHTEDELSEDFINNVLEIAYDDGLADSTELSYTLPRDASFDEIVERIDRLENEAEQNNTGMFNRLCAIIREQLEK